MKLENINNIEIKNIEQKMFRSFIKSNELKLLNLNNKIKKENNERENKIKGKNLFFRIKEKISKCISENKNNIQIWRGIVFNSYATLFIINMVISIMSYLGHAYLNNPAYSLNVKIGDYVNAHAWNGLFNFYSYIGIYSGNWLLKIFIENVNDESAIKKEASDLENFLIKLKYECDLYDKAKKDPTKKVLYDHSFMENIIDKIKNERISKKIMFDLSKNLSEEKLKILFSLPIINDRDFVTYGDVLKVIENFPDQTIDNLKKMTKKVSVNVTDII